MQGKSIASELAIVTGLIQNETISSELHEEPIRADRVETPGAGVTPVESAVPEKDEGDLAAGEADPEPAGKGNTRL